MTEVSFLNYHKDGAVVGLATDYLKLVMDSSGYEYNLTLMPWNRAFKTAQEEKNTLLFSVARTAEREKQFNWLFQIKEIQYYLYGLSTNESDYTEEDVCKTRKIAVVRDDVTHDYLKRNNCGKLILAQSYKQLDSLLARGRVDFIASSALGMKYFIQRHAHSSQDFYAHKKLDGLSTALYFAMNIESDVTVVQELQALFSQFTNHSAYDAIVNM